MLAIPKWRAGLCLRVRERALIQELDEILGEKHIQRPINRYAHLLFRTWQLAPVDAAPEKPREKSGEVYAENPRHTGADLLMPQCSAWLEEMERFARG